MTHAIAMLFCFSLLRNCRASVDIINSSTSQNASKKLLIFWPVSSKPEVIDLVKKNINRMRQTGGPDCCDVFLAHYDGHDEVWRASLGNDWYDREVTYSSTYAGNFKFKLLRKAFFEEGVSLAWAVRYSFVWVVDEDIDATNIDFGEFLQLIVNTNSFIIGPSYNGAHFGVHWPRKTCDFRYTNFVEVMAPVIQTSALQFVLGCEHCFHEESDWGLDFIWCKLVARKLNPDAAETVCAILDKTPIVHRDFKSLKAKYNMSKNRSDSEILPNFNTAGKDALKDTFKHFPELYVHRGEQRNYLCMCMGAPARSNIVPSCTDNETYMDPYGYSCLDWDGFSCYSYAVTSSYNLTPVEAEQIELNCPNACGLDCPGADTCSGSQENSTLDYELAGYGLGQRIAIASLVLAISAVGCLFVRASSSKWNVVRSSCSSSSSSDLDT